MALAASIKNLSFKQFLVLGKVFAFNPQFIIPTWKATRKTLKICDRRFGQDHHKNTPANAFRHALWNFIICEKCHKIAKSSDKAKSWSKKITDLHEKLLPNSELEKRMDLHNNGIGRSLFEKHILKTLNAPSILTGKMETATKIRTVEEINRVKDELVYIENDD